MNINPKLWRIVSVAVAGVILVVMLVAVQVPKAWKTEGAGGAEDFAEIADKIFIDYVVALEVLGVLLTAAMIGAMTIARPLGSVPDTANYPTRRSRHDVDVASNVSDVHFEESER